MPQFPTYLMNNCTQYQQPMYQPMQNPYMDRLQQVQLQQMVPTQMSGANQGLIARLVDSFDSITANDVPMNGGALFVKNDGSMIEYRSWKADGTISKTSYLTHIDDLDTQTIKVLNEEEKLKFDTFNEFLEGISKKVDYLSEKLDELVNPRQTSKNKKEVRVDE